MPGRAFGFAGTASAHAQPHRHSASAVNHAMILFKFLHLCSGIPPVNILLDAHNRKFVPRQAEPARTCCRQAEPARTGCRGGHTNPSAIDWSLRILRGRKTRGNAPQGLPRILSTTVGRHRLKRPKSSDFRKFSENPRSALPTRAGSARTHLLPRGPHESLGHRLEPQDSPWSKDSR